MSIKSLLGALLAKYVVYKNNSWISNPWQTQQNVMRDLVNAASNTAFGKDHRFSSINTYSDFKRCVPIRDYEGLKMYIERVKQGELNILWPGKPLYFAKTSGTTSGSKYIPLTKLSLNCQIKAAKDALLHYAYSSGNYHFIDGKMIFLQGSPLLNKEAYIPSGRLSGIVANYVPSYLQKNRLPSYKTNCIEDWEEKVEAIVGETVNEDMRLISGIPSWVQMYFEKLHQSTGKSISELFPNFSLFVFGGVNYAPYRKKFKELIGKNVDSLELYPASEGFIAFQDRHDKDDLLLLLDSGIFYEFIPVDEFHNPKPSRFTINDVCIGVHYVIILSTNAGLWGYNIGDTIQFTSIKPYRIVVTGRIKHFISAFGEHVIAKEVEEAISKALHEFPEVKVSEFTVAPQVNPKEDLPHHEWFVEFLTKPKNEILFAESIDLYLQKQNSYYKDLIEGGVLKSLNLSLVRSGGFNDYMKTKGKLGGQNKLPRLSNDRVIADALTPFLL